MKKERNSLDGARFKRWTGGQWAVFVITIAFLAWAIVGDVIAISVFATAEKSEKIANHLGWWMAKNICCLVATLSIIYHLIWGRHRKHQWLIPATFIVLMLICQLGAFSGDTYKSHEIIVISMATGLGAVAFAFAFQKRPVGMYICLGLGLACLLIAAALINHYDILEPIYDECSTIQQYGITASAYNPALTVLISLLAYIYERLDRKENHQSV